MDDKCYRCEYYDELWDGKEEYQFCDCADDKIPEWCPKRNNIEGSFEL